MQTRKRGLAGLLGVGGLLLFLLPGCIAGRVMTGVVPRDFPVGMPVPVALPCSPSLSGIAPQQVTLQVDGRTPAEERVAQLEPADPIGHTPARIWFMWSARASDLGKPVEVRFQPGRVDMIGTAYRTVMEDPMLHVRDAEGRLVLSYWHGPPSGELRHPMNDFIHPLTGLDGETLTALAPPDHLHHRGLYWTWVRHEVEGAYVGDWWIPKDIRANPTALDFGDGPVLTRFAAEHHWVHQPEDSSEGRPFVGERVVCRVFGTTKEGRGIDVDLTLTALADGVRIGGQTAKDKGYGGLTVRFNQAAEARIESDHGVVEDDNVNHLRARWVDWTGVFAGPDGAPLPHRSGAGVLVHPTHPDLPPEWITRRYGPINVSYPGLNMLEIPKDRPLRLRYRLWVHRGDAGEGRVADAYRAYAADWQWNDE